VNARLQAARKALSKTQKQIAEEVGITEYTYQLYEYGKRDPATRTSIRIAKALNRAVEELFGEDDGTHD